MNRLEALDRLEVIFKHIENKQLAKAMMAAGMSDEHFPDGLPLEELTQVLEVRVADLCRIAGVKVK